MQQCFNNDIIYRFRSRIAQRSDNGILATNETHNHVILVYIYLYIYIKI